MTPSTSSRDPPISSYGRGRLCRSMSSPCRSSLSLPRPVAPRWSGGRPVDRDFSQGPARHHAARRRGQGRSQNVAAGRHAPNDEYRAVIAWLPFNEITLRKCRKKCGKKRDRYSYNGFITRVAFDVILRQQHRVRRHCRLPT